MGVESEQKGEEIVDMKALGVITLRPMPTLNSSLNMQLM
jgi:hypothetical protein